METLKENEKLENHSTVLGRLSAQGLSLLAQPNYKTGPGTSVAHAQRAVIVSRAPVAAQRRPTARATRCVGSGGYDTSSGHRVHQARSRQRKRTVAAEQ
jgi:hypothetical protein